MPPEPQHPDPVREAAVGFARDVAALADDETRRRSTSLSALVLQAQHVVRLALADPPLGGVEQRTWQDAIDYLRTEFARENTDETYHFYAMHFAAALEDGRRFAARVEQVGGDERVATADLCVCANCGGEPELQLVCENCGNRTAHAGGGIEREAIAALWKASEDFESIIAHAPKSGAALLARHGRSAVSAVLRDAVAAFAQPEGEHTFVVRATYRNLAGATIRAWELVDGPMGPAEPTARESQEHSRLTLVPAKPSLEDGERT